MIQENAGHRMPIMLRHLPVLLLFPLCSPASGEVSFNRDIRPILTGNCFGCHGPDPSSRKADLRLDLRDHATAPAKSGAIPLIPGKPGESEMMKRILSTDADDVMPPPDAHRDLKPEQKETLRQWILEGGKYEGHWAFTKPVRPPVPDAGNFRNPVDAFITTRLRGAGLSPSAPADKHTLARRVALDLTGLPPSPKDLADFINDPSPAAYENYVDRLLASPRYGERWARMWMDIARYADSAGYGSDPLRLNMWPWRDWVIDAFNRNVPWDRFSRDQLAGDLEPGATREQKVATGFHRNTMTNTEGGTDDEEWRVAAVKDRAGVTSQAWMGLTMSCAQCHSHKFDPVSQEEYYRFYALFNQTEDNDQPDESPTLPLPTADESARLASLKKELKELESAMKADTRELEAEAAEWEKQQTRKVQWQTLDIASLETPGTAAPGWDKLPDQSILTKNTLTDGVTFTLSAKTSLRNLTGLKLEVLADDSLPGHGPGRAGSGNAVVSEVGVTARPDGLAPPVRYVRVELPGKHRFLHLAEVEVFSGGTNVAPAGKASQSSTDFGGEASRGNDGNTEGVFTRSSVTHTGNDNNPWWEVDLLEPRQVDRIVVWNRKEAPERMDNWKLIAFDGNHQPLWQREIKKAPAPFTESRVDVSRTATLSRATADFSQEGWSPSMAIDGKPGTGWAWAPQFGRNHTGIFRFAQPLDMGTPGMALSIILAQNFGQQHMLGRFRLSVTDALQPPDALPESLQAVLAIAPEARTPAQRKSVLDYVRPFSQSVAGIGKRITERKNAIAGIVPVAVPVMRELPPGRQRKTHFLNKGNFLDQGAEVQPGFPVAFGAIPPGTPMNRAGVATWIFSPENPLTARVTVNRFWAQLFGTGIVETEEDFGTQGTYPSHPELLDWLAVEFQETGWDVKRLLKLLVTSDTYRQTSAVPAGASAAAADARNTLLSRFPRRRLDAEQVRDQALALSGLLSPKLGGPSVYPPQPDGLWKAAFNGERTYTTSQGEDKYRRGLYTIWRRTVPYPSMAAFDAPSREACTIRRIPTNTPLQAYVTLNDPVYVEAAQALARRMIREGGGDTSTRIRYGLSLVQSRPATEAAANALEKLYASEFARYSQDSAAARKLATEPLGPLPQGVPEAEAAAWTAVANILLNLDGVLMKS